MGFIFFTALLATAYLILQLFYLWHWKKTPKLEVPVDYIPYTHFSVVVVARNEENTIEACLQSILKQHYPPDLFEVIIINDRSTDNTVEIINSIQSPAMRLYHLSDFAEMLHPPAFKKSAIELAIRQARYDWIVMTDADCITPSEWLRTLAYSQLVTKSVFLAAPALYVSRHSMLEKMQEMELMILMLITAAGIRSGLHDMANGANMTFSKKAFLAVGGYKDNFQYASGDDMFLVEKMRSAFPALISFVKSNNAVVKSMPHQDWSSLLKQRIRWAGKNKGLRNPVIRLIWTFVGFYHVAIVIAILLALIQLSTLWPVLILVSSKWIADAILLHQTSRFFKGKSMLGDFVPLELMYTFYILLLGWNLMIGRKGDW